MAGLFVSGVKSKAWWCSLVGILGCRRTVSSSPAAEMVSQRGCFSQQTRDWKEKRERFQGSHRSYQLQLFICLLQHFSVSSSHPPSLPLFNHFAPLETTTASVKQLGRWLFLTYSNNSSPCRMILLVSLSISEIQLPPKIYPGCQERESNFKSSEVEYFMREASMLCV